LIVRWTGKVSPAVNKNLVDSTDFLPTVAAAAGVPIPDDVRLDGISFYEQLRGQPGDVRPWVFCHYDPRPGWDKDQFRKIRFARDDRYKLYGDGKLFDVIRDPLEHQAIQPSAAIDVARDARQRLAAVLADMPNPDPEPRDGDPRESEQRLYLAAGQRISVFEAAAESGDLKLLQELALDGAGPFTFAPNRKLVYVASRLTDAKKKTPAITTLKIRPDGTLERVHAAEVKMRPGYLMPDNNGEFLAGNHYGPGKASVWKIDPVYRGTTVGELTLEAKAHSAVFSPDNHWLLVPATGPNKVFINKFIAQVGTIEPHEPPFVSGPSQANEARQPRHLIFHPNLSIAYTTNERERPGVCVWRWDTENGRLEPIQNIVTARADSKTSITTADLHLTPDARFLYVSNRDVSKRNALVGEDTLVGFEVDPQTGMLTMLGHTPCERIPRSFTVDKLGSYVYVAGQGDDKVGAYQIEESGALRKIRAYDVGKNPIWIATLSLPH
ncbi:MAG: beta-propeller fold lactonase family protein, partial [Planctomycetota bacterium]